MALHVSQRRLAAFAIVATAVGAAFLAGGALWAAGLGLIGGAAAALGGGGAPCLPERAASPAPLEGGRARWAREIVGAMPEPMLLIEAGGILSANPPAKALLGQWIEGQDVRL